LAEVVKSRLRVFFARERLALDPNDPETVERYLSKATQAQAYVETMRLNTLRAKGKLEKQGVIPQGTGTGKYGYRWDAKEKKRVPIDYEVKVLQKMFTMVDEGASTFCVARTLNDLNIPSKSGGKWEARTVGRLLTDPACIGLTYFGRTRGSRKTGLRPQPKDKWTLLPDATPPVIGKDLFERVQAELQRRTEQRKAAPQREYVLTGHIVCGYCGKPVVGSCLSRRHRYYRCRATRPTASESQSCKAGYIRADYLESVVWEKLSEVLQDPQLILAEYRRQIQGQRNGLEDGGSLEREMAELRRRLKKYDTEEKRLVSLFRFGEIKEDNILDELNHLKKERQSDQDQLSQLVRAKERLASLLNAEIKLSEFCERVRQNISHCGINERRLALDALGVKITASKDRIDIQGAIPVEAKSTPTSSDVTTIGQTWECLIALYYDGRSHKQSASIVPWGEATTAPDQLVLDQAMVARHLAMG